MTVNKFPPHPSTQFWATIESFWGGAENEVNRNDYV